MSNGISDDLHNCDTLLLDMDGTLLDLGYDNHIWWNVVPEAFATKHDVPLAEARADLLAKMRELQGTLDWYCLDFWSSEFNLDIAGLHRDLDHRIGYLPGAEQFLTDVAASDRRVLLVTNSHHTTLDIKHAVTGVKRFFDGIFTSFDIGYPKEEQPFWQELQRRVDFDSDSTVFVDDNLEVLTSARKYGLRHVVAIEEPDTSRPARTVDGFPSIGGVADLFSR